MKKYKVIVLLLTLQLTLQADLLERFQILSKHNNADAFADEELGVNFIGGDGLVRADVVDINPVHVSLPKFKAGCGGIDYTLGAINIASGKEMLGALKSIIKNGAGYAFQLSLETVSPSIAENVSKIQDYANALNSININSCEMAQTLVNAAWPSSQAADQFICQQSNGVFGKKFEDNIEARHKCHTNTDGTLDQALKEQTQKSDLLAGDYNIAKRVFKKLNLSPEEEDFFLNITGSVVSIDGQVKTYPPKEIKTCDTLLKGGNLQDAYKFDGEYGIKQEPLVIAKENSWCEKRIKAMKSLFEKIKTGKKGDGFLSETEKNLLNSSKLPIGTLLVLKTRSANYGAMLDLESYAEIDAYETLRESVFDVLREVRALAITLLDAQVSDEKLKAYIATLDEARANITLESAKIMKKISEIQQLEKWLREIELMERTPKD
jgi:conjugative transfer pilus assembly protein TraH